jgi:hypothetical protein
MTVVTETTQKKSVKGLAIGLALLALSFYVGFFFLMYYR